jgi:hypothetical protein
MSHHGGGKFDPSGNPWDDPIPERGGYDGTENLEQTAVMPLRHKFIAIGIGLVIVAFLLTAEGIRILPGSLDFWAIVIALLLAGFFAIRGEH